jgi:hypothetical protein
MISGMAGSSIVSEKNTTKRVLLRRARASHAEDGILLEEGEDEVAPEDLCCLIVRPSCSALSGITKV